LCNIAGMRSGKTKTTSLSLEPSTLQDLQALAQRRHGGNVSALLAETAHREAKFLAAERFFDKYGVLPLDGLALDDISREWSEAIGAKKPRRRVV
jgi:hypothetical protein